VDQEAGRRSIHLQIDFWSSGHIGQVLSSSNPTIATSTYKIPPYQSILNWRLTQFVQERKEGDDVFCLLLKADLLRSLNSNLMSTAQHSVQLNNVIVLRSFDNKATIVWYDRREWFHFRTSIGASPSLELWNFSSGCEIRGEYFWAPSFLMKHIIVNHSIWYSKVSLT